MLVFHEVWGLILANMVWALEQKHQAPYRIYWDSFRKSIEIGMNLIYQGGIDLC